MASDHLLLRQAVVSGSALVYWGGVLLHARRIRRKIGRTPNLRPKGPRETLLWTGWLIVIAVWIAQPWLVRGGSGSAPLSLIGGLLNPFTLAAGVVLIVVGYIATLRCYSVMGSAWRIGISPQEKTTLITTGPFALIRHPLYAFQIVMLIGAFFLIPTVLSIAIFVLHFICVLIKANAEESYLEKMYGEEYREYKARSGALLPKMKS